MPLRSNTKKRVRSLSLSKGENDSPNTFVATPTPPNKRARAESVNSSVVEGSITSLNETTDVSI